MKRKIQRKHLIKTDKKETKLMMIILYLNDT